MPNSAKNTSVIDTLAAVKRGSSKNWICSMGCSARSSHQMKMPSRTAAMPSAVKVEIEVHPCEGASMMPYTRATSPAIDSAAPTGSSGVAAGSRDSGTTRQP